MKTISSDVNGDLKNVGVKKPGRPPKIKRGRPKRIMFPRLPKPAELTYRTSSRCIVSGCTNTDKWMFSLPEADDLRERWLEFISPPDGTPDKDVRVCEFHFEQQMWKRTRDGQRTLLPDAFPTLSNLERGDEAKGNLNVVDVHNFEDSGVYIKSELLEPEINLSEEPILSIPSVFIERKNSAKVYSRKQKYLMNIKSNPVKYAAYLEGERLRHRIRRKSLQTSLHSEEEDGLKKEDIDLHEHLIKAQFSAIKVEPLFPVKEEAIVPDLVAPYNNNVEEMKNLEMENLESENLEGTSTDPLASLVVENGYRCPICNKHLTRKGFLESHLEKTHPSEEIALRWTGVESDLETRLKLQKREDILKKHARWDEIVLPDMTSETSTNPSSSLVNLTSPNSSVVTNNVPVMSSLEESQGKIAPENKDRLLKNYIQWEEQLDYKTNKNPSKCTQELQAKSQLWYQLPQPQPQTDLTLSIQQLLESNSEVYDPSEANKEVQFKIRDASSYMFCASLLSLPVEKRLIVKQKLMEVVNAVLTRNLDPERIIIAYTP